MINFSLGFIFHFFPECCETVINNTGKNNTLHVHGEILVPTHYYLLFGILKVKIYIKREN